MSLDFIERDENGAAHIKINVTDEVRVAAEKVVDAYQALLEARAYRGYGSAEKALGKASGIATAELRGAARKANPELPARAFGIHPSAEEEGEKAQYMSRNSRQLRRDMYLAVNDTLNGLLKEIADTKGVEAPVLESANRERTS